MNVIFDLLLNKKMYFNWKIAKKKHFKNPFYLQFKSMPNCYCNSAKFIFMKENLSALLLFFVKWRSWFNLDGYKLLENVFIRSWLYDHGDIRNVVFHFHSIFPTLNEHLYWYKLLCSRVSTKKMGESVA